MKPPALTKTEVLLTFAYIDGDNAVFEEANRGVDDLSIGFAMTVLRWYNLGAPSEITVTIEPGDRLNK